MCVFLRGVVTDELSPYVEPFFVEFDNFPPRTPWWWTEALLSPRSRSTWNARLPAFPFPSHTNHSLLVHTYFFFVHQKFVENRFFLALCLTLLLAQRLHPHTHTRSNCKKNYSQTKPRSHKLFSTPRRRRRRSILEHSWCHCGTCIPGAHTLLPCQSRTRQSVFLSVYSTSTTASTGSSAPLDH